MDSRAFWLRWKTRGWAYSFSIAATLALGILIGTVVSYGVKGKEGQKSSDATPLTVPSPKQMSNAFSQIAKQLGPSVVNPPIANDASTLPGLKSYCGASATSVAVPRKAVRLKENRPVFSNFGENT